MIINSGARTDIPAFYSRWFMNRIHDGYVCVRNPYYEEQVTRYRLSPDLVDVLAFCSKNPAPMLPRITELKEYRQFWFVTITPYEADIEENVPPNENVIQSFQELSGALGRKAVQWRYDPVLITEKYSVDFHVDAFEHIAAELENFTEIAVVSFLDLYEKTKRNFPEAREVRPDEQEKLIRAFVSSGKRHGMTVRACLENPELRRFGAVPDGCMTRAVLEEATGITLDIPGGAGPRAGCNCVLGHDIGMYNTCAHFCKYCYANYDRETVIRNMKRHNPDSPFLIGNSMPGDTVHEAVQRPWVSNQISLFV